MALIGAILVEIKIIKILCERSLREGDRYALRPSILTLAKLSPTLSKVCTHPVPLPSIPPFASPSSRRQSQDYGICNDACFNEYS